MQVGLTTLRKFRTLRFSQGSVNSGEALSFPRCFSRQSACILGVHPKGPDIEGLTLAWAGPYTPKAKKQG